MRKLNKPTDSETKKLSLDGLFNLLITYKKRIAIVSSVSIVVLGFFVYVQKDFYFYVEYGLFKQGEKIVDNKKDLKYYDIVLYDTFCNTFTFKLYMKWQPLPNRLKVKKICKELNTIYNDLKPITDNGANDE